MKLPSRRELVWLSLILLAGGLVRCLYLFEIVDSPDFRWPGVDAEFHDYWAKGLATGVWHLPHGAEDPQLATTPYFRPPGYPYFLAGVYWVTDSNPIATRVVQMALGLANCALAFFIGRRWFGFLTGAVYAAGMALYWSFVYFEGELHAPPLLILLLLTTLFALGRWADEGSHRFVILAAVSLGLGVLVRPDVGLLVPTAACWIVWIAIRRGDWTRSIRTVLLFCVTTVATVIPATLRNAAVSGEFVPICTNGGINLYIGNNEEATGMCLAVLPEVGEFGTCFDYPRILKTLEKREKRPFSQTDASAWFTKEAVRFIHENPGRFLSLLLAKACMFWGPVEIGHNKQDHFERLNSRVLSSLPGNFTLVASLALVGFVLIFRGRTDQPPSTTRDQRHAMAILFAFSCLALFVAVLPFFVAGRYRVPVVALLLLPAAETVAQILRATRNGRRRHAAIMVVVCAALYVLMRLIPVPHEPDPGRWHFSRGCASLRAGDPVSAERELRLAAEAPSADRDVRAKAYHNLGYALGLMARFDEAAAACRESLRLIPGNARTHNDLGINLQNSGDQAGAVSEFMRAMELDPEIAAPWRNLGRLRLMEGRLDDGIELLRRALAIEPNHGPTLFFLARALMLKSDWPGAVDQYRHSIAVNPEHTQSLTDLAWLKATCPDARFRDGPDAVRLAQRAVNTPQGRNFFAYDALAAAYAEVGDFGKAITAARESARLAVAEGRTAEADRIVARLRLYEQQTTYRDTKQ